ncbi:MAG TPA: phosphatidate cytidylyltransferase [Candidatus Izemoplasmatales bacterium]|nr:phosphatidate cytidylyltransferase [Candidatus Izemoplasmatales bacterium]
MKTRIITASILILVMGTILIFGQGNLEFLFSGGVLLLATFAAYELMVRCHRHKKPVYWYHYLPVALTFVFVLLNILVFNQSNYEQFILLFVFGMVFVYLILYLIDGRMHRGELGVSLLTIFYTSLGFIALAFLRRLALDMVLYLLIITIMTDTFAYFLGIRFGKHKLMPKVSPKKSIEGALGGLAFGASFGVVFALVFNVFENFNLNVFAIVILSIALSVVSQSGDLIASKFKREVGLKDYSNIFPGHGGVLDRFDSTMFAAILLMLVLQVV